MKLESQCCLKCKKRHMGCHAKCADYLEAKERLDKIKEEMQKEKKHGRLLCGCGKAQKENVPGEK